MYGIHILPYGYFRIESRASRLEVNRTALKSHNSSKCGEDIKNNPQLRMVRGGFPGTVIETDSSQWTEFPFNLPKRAKK